MTAHKKVLIIAYLFPPIGGGGVQRALKMAKYLGEFGWEVHVLTVDPIHHVSLDHSLLDQLPKEVHIHRSKELSPWNRKSKTTAVSTLTNSSIITSITSSGKRFIINQLKKMK